MKVSLVDAQLELKALRTLAAGGELGDKMASLLDREHFGYLPAIKAYRRIARSMKDEGRIPSWDYLIRDPILSEAHREILSSTTVPPCKKPEALKELFDELESKRMLRLGVDAIEAFNDSVANPEKPYSEIVADLRTRLSTLHTKTSTEEIFTVGKGANASSVIRNMLDGELTPVIPTGYPDFDDENGGIPFGSLFIIGAPTGVGKTALATCMGKNMALAGHSTCIVSLEMNENMMYSRIMSIETGVALKNITQKKFTPEESTQIEDAYRRLSKRLKRAESRLSVYVPSRDVSMEDVLYSLKPYEYSVIIVDYVSLLAGMSDEDQWKKLGEATRFAKRFAEIENLVVVVLVQVNEQGLVRYSRTMQEHASNLWLCSMQSEEGAKFGILNVTQPKGRNQSRHPFKLYNDFPTSNIRGLSEKEKKSMVGPSDAVKGVRKDAKQRNVLEEDNNPI